MSDTLATLTAKAAKFEQMLTQSALSKSGDPPWVHSDVYLDIDEDGVDVIVSAGGGSVLTWCEFEPSYFEEIEGEATAMLSVDPTLERLDIASGDGRMAFDFRGPDEDDLAETLVGRGALEMAVALPASEAALEKVPHDFPERFNDEDRFLSPSGNPHQTVIQTRVDEVQKVIEAVGLDDSLDYFPIAVTDGEFTLDVGDEIEYIRGDLQGDVEGPDLKNWYGPGFEAAFEKTLSGPVELQTTGTDGGGTPMAVVQNASNSTLRHVLVQVNPA